MYPPRRLKVPSPQLSLTVTVFCLVFFLQSPCQSDLGPWSLHEESDETRSWKVDQCLQQVSSDAGVPQLGAKTNQAAETCVVVATAAQKVSSLLQLTLLLEDASDVTPLCGHVDE